MRSSNIIAIHRGQQAHCFLSSGDTVLHEWCDAIAGHCFDQECRGATELLTRGGGQNGTSHQGHCRLVRPSMRHNLLLHTSPKQQSCECCTCVCTSCAKGLHHGQRLLPVQLICAYKQTCKVQIANLCNVPLQRCKGSCGRQCVWRDGHALHREVWHDGTQAAVQVRYAQILQVSILPQSLLWPVLHTSSIICMTEHTTHACPQL